MKDTRYPFLFAIPRGASRADRERAPGHIAKTYGIRGPIEHVRSDEQFHLYRVTNPNIEDATS